MTPPGECCPLCMNPGDDASVGPCDHASYQTFVSEELDAIDALSYDRHHAAAAVKAYRAHGAAAAGAPLICVVLLLIGGCGGDVARSSTPDAAPDGASGNAGGSSGNARNDGQSTAGTSGAGGSSSRDGGHLDASVDASVPPKRPGFVPCAGLPPLLPPTECDTRTGDVCCVVMSPGFTRPIQECRSAAGGAFCFTIAECDQDEDCAPGSRCVRLDLPPVVFACRTTHDASVPP